MIETPEGAQWCLVDVANTIARVVFADLTEQTLDGIAKSIELLGRYVGVRERVGERVRETMIYTQCKPVVTSYSNTGTTHMSNTGWRIYILHYITY